VTDAGSQPGDVSFVIDELLAHARFGPLIDADRIGGYRGVQPQFFVQLAPGASMEDVFAVAIRIFGVHMTAEK